MKPGISKILTTTLKISVSVGALVYVFSKIEMARVLEIAGKTNYLFVFAALVLFVLSKIIAAIRLNKLYGTIGIVLDEMYNLRLYLLGMFYNLFLPGGIGGDGYKIYILNRVYGVKAGKIFWAVFIDRLSGVVALFCLAFFFASLIDFNFSFPHRYISILCIPLSLVAFYFFLRFFFHHFAKVFNKVIPLSFMVQLLQILCAYCILTAIGGGNNVTGYMFLFLISSIVAMLPITIGGAGSREITFMVGSGMLGLDENISIALSLIFYVITLFTSFWGIIYSVKPGYFERVIGTR